MNLLKRAIRDPLFLAGAVMFVIGSGPLLVSIIATELRLTDDPNPNPVGLGILAMLTFWPSLIMMAFALLRTSRSGASDATEHGHEDD